MQMPIRKNDDTEAELSFLFVFGIPNRLYARAFVMGVRSIPCPTCTYVPRLIYVQYCSKKQQTFHDLWAGEHDCVKFNESLSISI